MMGFMACVGLASIPALSVTRRRRKPDHTMQGGAGESGGGGTPESLCQEWSAREAHGRLGLRVTGPVGVFVT